MRVPRVRRHAVGFCGFPIPELCSSLGMKEVQASRMKPKYCSRAYHSKVRRCSCRHERPTCVRPSAPLLLPTYACKTGKGASKQEREKDRRLAHLRCCFLVLPYLNRPAFPVLGGQSVPWLIATGARGRGGGCVID